MFIDVGTFVEVRTDSPLADLRGKFGFVDKVRIMNHNGDVLVWLELFELNRRAARLVMVSPTDIRRKVNQISKTQAKIKRSLASNDDHLIAMLDLRQA